MSSNNRIINSVVYGSLISGLLFFYSNYFFIKYDSNPEPDMPTFLYETKYSLCKKACESINEKHCSEWTSIVSHGKICDYACDGYIDTDYVDYDSEWVSMFTCAAKAESAQELRECDLACTVMDEI